jgi:hypothetical protein
MQLPARPARCAGRPAPPDRPFPAPAASCVKGLARGGQSQTAVSAGKEHHAQALLELLNLLTEGGLGDM